MQEKRRRKILKTPMLSFHEDSFPRLAATAVVGLAIAVVGGRTQVSWNFDGDIR